MERDRAANKWLILIALLSVTVTIVCLMTVPAMAQEGQWNKTFGGMGDDYGYSVQQTSDGGYIIAGYTYSYGAGDFDVWLIETDSNGTEQWNRTFGGAEADLLDRGSVRQTSDGGYIITGYTYSYGAGDADVWLIKTDLDGIETWNRTFGKEWVDWGHSVQQTADGGYIIAGRTDPYAGARADAWLIKTNSTGIEEWNRTFGTEACEYAASVEQTVDGGYIVAGRTSSYGVGVVDAWLIRTDSNGTEEWNRTFGGPYYDYGYSVQQTTDGGYIMVGSTNNRQDIWLIKTDQDGIEVWNRTFGGPAIDEGYSIQQTADGGYIVAGYTESYGAGSSDIWLIKADSNGTEQWNKAFGGAGLEKGYSIQQTADSGYIVAGYTESYGVGGYDVWLIKSSTSAPKPDLITTTITPLSFFPNQPKAITATIANTGSADAGSFNVSLSTDGAIVDTVGVISLCTGNTVDVSFTWTPAVGDRELCVFADCDFAINESNEDNNELCKDVTVHVNTLYFMPIRSRVPCNSTIVELRVNTTDAIGHILTDISFDPACINITEVDFGPGFTLADWVHKGDHITVDGFDFSPSCTQWNDRLLANLTVRCKNCYCISQLSFTGLENITKLIECGGKASYGANWADGSVRCEIPIIPEEIFDTGPGTYPSISGTHKGTITPKHDILIEQLYTYPCEGTGGHSEYAAFYYQNGTEIGNASWTGYAGDWHNISFDAPITLEADETYNYTIKTGSYPQIIHKQKLETGEGEITCLQFEDANGKIYYDWILAIKLLGAKISPDTWEDLGNLTDDFYNLPEIADGISEKERSALKQISVLTKSKDTEVQRGLQLIDKYGVPGYVFEHPEGWIPDYNTRLEVLLWLAENRTIVDGYDRIALCLALDYGSVVTIGDDQVDQSVRQYVLDIYDYVKETDKILVEKNISWRAKDYPLDAGVGLCWGANKLRYPTFYDYVGQDPGQPWMHYWREEFRDRQMNIEDFNWLFISKGTLEEMRDWASDTGLVNRSNMGETAKLIDVYLGKRLEYHSDYYRPPDSPPTYFEVEGKITPGCRISNPDWQWEYFKQNGTIIGICEDVSFADCMFLQSLNVGKYETFVHSGSFWHHVILYCDTENNVLKTTSRQVDIIDEHATPPIMYGGYKVPWDNFCGYGIYAFWITSDDKKLLESGVPFSYLSIEPFLFQKEKFIEEK